MLSIVFFFNDTPTTKIYTLSLHDALPIYCVSLFGLCGGLIGGSLFEFEYCDESGDFGTWIFFSGFYLLFYCEHFKTIFLVVFFVYQSSRVFVHDVYRGIGF